MLKWGKLIRRTDLTKKENSWVTFSTDGKWDITCYKLKNPPPTHYYVEVKGQSGHLLWNWRGVDKNRLIAHAKKVLNNFLYPLPNKTKIYPKTKEAKVAKTTKRKIPKRTLKGSALNSRFNKIANKNTKNIKSTNTRFLGTIKEGMYLYIHKKKMRKKK